MKNFLLVALFSLSAFSAQAQFKVGANVGIPVGGYSDFFALSLGIDAYKMFGGEDGVIQFGGMVGFLNYFGKNYDLAGQTIEGQGIPFIPLAAAARVNIGGVLTVGPDVGYAFTLKDNFKSGFYFKLVAGIDISDVLELNAFYHSISVGDGIELYDESGNSLGSIGLGALLEFGG